MKKEVLWSLVYLHAISIMTFPTLQSPCAAHDDPNAGVPALRAVKVEAPLTVDGILDEHAKDFG